MHFCDGAIVTPRDQVSFNLHQQRTRRSGWLRERDRARL